MSMSLPFFYVEKVPTETGVLIELDENATRHLVQVLRKRSGDSIIITDGGGTKLLAEVAESQKKKSTVMVKEVEIVPEPLPRITIAISLLKNVSRFEWFLEKVAETGVHEIIPLLCERTEKIHLRPERSKNILVSAMLQSQQYRLPRLGSPVNYREWLTTVQGDNFFIAHCAEADKQKPGDMARPGGNKLICIGPEGDFTPEEINAATERGFIPVSLGNTRLRTETAGVAAAVLLRLL